MNQLSEYDVAIAACSSYEEDAVEAAMRKAIDSVNGLSFVTPGMRIAIKVNLVTAMKPDSAATVHPSVVCALTRILRERGAEGERRGELLHAPFDDVRLRLGVVGDGEDYDVEPSFERGRH